MNWKQITLTINKGSTLVPIEIFGDAQQQKKVVPIEDIARILAVSKSESYSLVTPPNVIQKIQKGHYEYAIVFSPSHIREANMVLNSEFTMPVRFPNMLFCLQFSGGRWRDAKIYSTEDGIWHPGMKYWDMPISNYGNFTCLGTEKGLVGNMYNGSDLDLMKCARFPEIFLGSFFNNHLGENGGPRVGRYRDHIANMIAYINDEDIDNEDIQSDFENNPVHIYAIETLKNHPHFEEICEQKRHFTSGFFVWLYNALYPNEHFTPELIYPSAKPLSYEEVVAQITN